MRGLRFCMKRLVTTSNCPSLVHWADLTLLRLTICDVWHSQAGSEAARRMARGTLIGSSCSALAYARARLSSVNHRFFHPRKFRTPLGFCACPMNHGCNFERGRDTERPVYPDSLTCMLDRCFSQLLYLMVLSWCVSDHLIRVLKATATQSRPVSYQQYLRPVHCRRQLLADLLPASQIV